MSNSKKIRSEKPKNVLFIVIDALRADKCFVVNRKSVETPNIDSLYQKGTIFSQAIASATCTTPCVASILTGLYPFAHGIRSLYHCKLHPQCKTLPELLKEKGYNTYAQVTGPLLPLTGLDKGFTEYVCRNREDNAYSRWGRNLVERFRNKKFHEPWFVFVHFWELHSPRTIPKPNIFWKNRYLRYILPHSPYERALSALDSYLGKIFQYLDYQNTILVFHADHGERIYETFKDKLSAFLSEARWKITSKKRRPRLKLTFHGFYVLDYLIRVPLIFVGEGTFPAGKKIVDQVRQVDIFPTIVDALGLDTNGDFQIHGQSLLPLVENEKAEARSAYLEGISWGYILEGVRTSNHKYVKITYDDFDVSEQLYDLKNDPEEKENILNKFPKVAQDLKRKLKAITDRKYSAFTQVYSKAEREKIKERLRYLGYL